MAWTTGIWLIALCYEMVLKYIVKVDNPPSWIAIVHGWVYFVYLLFTANLAVKVRWPIGKTIGVLLAGTIPLLGIIVEHFQHQGHQGSASASRAAPRRELATPGRHGADESARSALTVSMRAPAAPAPAAPAPGRGARPRPSRPGSTPPRCASSPSGTNTGS